jgi:hypothetical protein
MLDVAQVANIGSVFFAYELREGAFLAARAQWARLVATIGRIMIVKTFGGQVREFDGEELTDTTIELREARG